MKKIISFVLAIVLILCMTTAVFAENVEIKMFTQRYDPDGSNYGDWSIGAYNRFNHTVTFTIPVYALYGYMNSDYYMEFVLPNSDLTGSASITKINWSIIVGDEKYDLAAGDGVSTSTIINRVYFGATTNSYYEDEGGVHWATIPQSTAYGDVTSIKLVATYTNDLPFIFDAILNSTNYYVRLYSSDDQTFVPQSASYMKDWNGVDDYTTVTIFPTYTFVTDEWDTNWYDEENYVDKYTLISFDRNQENEQSIINLAQNGAKLVVELDNPLNGQATYTLWAKNYGSVSGSDWQYNNNCVYISSFELDGTTSTLEFDVPYSALYDAKNGLLVHQFAIFENITLYNPTLMKDPIHFDTDDWWDSNNYHAIRLTKYGSGSLGRLSWTWSKIVNFDAPNTWTPNPVRYAYGGSTTDLYTPYTDSTPAKATSIKLVISDNIVEPGEEVPPHIHTLTYGSDVNVHWQFCEECEQIVSLTEHTYDNGKCTVCGAKETKFGDINGDGIVNINDAIALLKRIAGLE